MVSSRTGIARLWRNWSGYRCSAAWAGVITLAVTAVCDLVRLEISPMSGDFFTLVGGWSTVCGTLYLVCHAAGSYLCLVDGNFGVDGEALGFWMTTLGNQSWGWSSFGRHIGRSI